MTTHAKLGRVLAATIALVASGTTLGCAVSAYPENTYVDGDYPPADFIATVQPVYFEGHAAYFYNNRWYYRDGNRWGHYDHEPPALATHRAQFTASARVNYARPSTRTAVARGRR